jgi:hypothetical protein
MSSGEGRTRRTYPLACDAIKAGRYRTEHVTTRSASGKGTQNMCLVWRGKLIVAECPSAGQALKWINDKEAAIRASVRR